MDWLFSFFDLLAKTAFAVGPFFILLGALIFIHELGHFLAARYFGVRVEVFSLGFGPKILKYKKGDTVYCLSLLPLGGYVKMFGDSPLEEVPDSEKPKGFLYKRVHEKWLIAFAGPFMNLIFTVLAFFILALYGVPSLPPQLGDIDKSSPAGKAGFRSGDKILSVNGQAIFHQDELDKIIKNSINEELVFKAQSPAHKIRALSATARSIKNPNIFERKKFIGAIEGLNFHSAGLRIGVIHGSPAYQAGLRSFDEIKKVNQKDVRYWRDFKAFVQSANPPSLSLAVKRAAKEKLITVKFSGQQLSRSLKVLGIEPAELYVERVGPDTPAQKAGLAPGDRLLSINGQPIQSWKQVLDTVKSYSGQPPLKVWPDNKALNTAKPYSSHPFSIKYRRRGQEGLISLSPELLFTKGSMKKRFMLGIASGGQIAFPERIVKERSFFQSVVYSGQETVKWLDVIAIFLVRLTQGEVSARYIGGPVEIGRVAHSSFQAGLQEFLFVMALISLNLFFLNLLPIPMLDGGHILFFTLEGILGRPLSVQKLIVAQQAGLLILVSFMGFAFYNDIYNWLKAW